jgi:2-oxoglutarate ferredoxin oxidoreductase subunit beta
MTPMESFRNDVENQWCPGCPNHGILTALQRALVALDVAPHEVCMVSGIGQAAKLPHYLRANVFNGLHGRAIPAALGIHLARPSLKTLVVSGDGDLYGEGGNHLLHAFRRNPDVTVVVHNNQIYALTKGQASPTTPRGERTRLQFDGVHVDPIQMLATAIVHDCSFVARGFALDGDSLEGLLRQALVHRGLSLVEIVQPCITWGRQTIDMYRERLVPVPEGHDRSDRGAAIDLARRAPEELVTGILYELPPRPTYADNLLGSTALADEPSDRRSAVESRLGELRVSA